MGGPEFKILRHLNRSSHASRILYNHARVSPSAWVSELRLVEMLDWLADRIRFRYPHTQRIVLPNNTGTN